MFCPGVAFSLVPAGDQLVYPEAWGLFTSVNDSTEPACFSLNEISSLRLDGTSLMKC